jgi:hypothetical protein
MKILQPSFLVKRGGAHSRRNERGSLTVVLLVFLAIMVIYVGANIRMLNCLKAEIKVVEKKQVRRLQPLTVPTNAVAGEAAPPLAAAPARP